MLIANADAARTTARTRSISSRDTYLGTCLHELDWTSTSSLVPMIEIVVYARILAHLCTEGSGRKSKADACRRSDATLPSLRFYLYMLVVAAWSAREARRISEGSNLQLCCSLYEA